MFIDGQRVRDFHPVQEKDENGGFTRRPSTFRNWITPDGRPGPTGEGDFPAESGRYHIFVAMICPWACRTLMVRKLKGLDDLVSISVLDPRLTPKVWRFGGHDGTFPETDADPLYDSEYLYELYLRADKVYTGEITVPVLWDKRRETIVNNESSEIIRMFNDGFGKMADNAIDLYPADLRKEIDRVNDRLYDRFNNGVYRAGFASTQIAHDQAAGEVFDSLDWLEERLLEQDYLVGNRITEADVRAFVTLIRFDLAYHGLFKLNRRQVRDYPSIRTYLQRIHGLPGIRETVNPEHIKAGYYSIRALNPTGIAPSGPATLW